MSELRYAQVGSPVIHVVPTRLGILRLRCNGRPVDPRDLFDPGSQVWSERHGDRCPGCARKHPSLDGDHAPPADH